MSRIGKNPITVPSGVTVSVAGDQVTVAGPKGTMTRALPSGMALQHAFRYNYPDVTDSVILVNVGDGDGLVCSPARYRASQRSRASPAVSLIDGANRACRGMGRMQGGYWPTGIAKSPRTSRQVQ